MLILSRRQNEKVDFPNLGITVEVLRTGTKKVQLGIDAPPEIRVIRSELAFNGDHQQHATVDRSNSEQLRRELGDIALAIQLSQNQIRQGLTEHAEHALHDALNLLRRIDDSLTGSFDDSTSDLMARESRAAYETPKPVKVCAIVDDWIAANFAVDLV